MKPSFNTFSQINSFVAQQIVDITTQIPEFSNAYPSSEYLKRMSDKNCLIQIALVEGKAIGFKLGYEKSSSHFYSWMGGICPDYRKMGIAKALAKQQETWATENGYQTIGMKTRNYLKSMLHFTLSNQFYITGVEVYPNPMENRILLEKKLLSIGK